MRAVVFVSTVQNPEEPLHCSDSRTLDRVVENEIINDFDLIAVEKAVQLKESGAFGEVIAFSLSPEKTHLLKVLAMGADRAVWGCSGNGGLTPQTVVRTALEAVPDDGQTVYLLGKMGVNYESHITAQLLAQALDIPCMSSCFALECEGGRWRADCEEDGGVAHYRPSGPFVVSAELRLAEPRFPSLPNIIRAKKKLVDEIDVCFAPSDAVVRKMAVLQDFGRHCRMISADNFCAEIASAIKADA